MKINAAQRLVSVRIIPTKNAYSDRDGKEDLNRYVKDKANNIMKHVPINKEFSLDISKREGYDKHIIYLLQKAKPVGLVALAAFRDAKNVFKPASYMSPEVRGKGLALMIYRWLLDNGITLKSDTEQSAMSNGLWQRLSREYPLYVLNLKTKIISKYEKEKNSFNEGLILLGKGQNINNFAKRFGYAFEQ